MAAICLGLNVLMESIMLSKLQLLGPKFDGMIV